MPGPRLFVWGNGAYRDNGLATEFLRQVASRGFRRFNGDRAKIAIIAGTRATAVARQPPPRNADERRAPRCSYD
jgi:hypothetical protein